VFAFIPQNLTLSTSIVVGPTEYNATVNRNLRLDSPFTINESADFEMIFNLGGNNTDMGTFMIDLDRTNAVVVKNLINASENSTNVEESIFSGRDDDTARYISKKVLIPNGQTAKEIKVILDANIPKDTFIRVYAKTYNSEQITSDLVGYKRMAIESTSEFFVGGVFTNSLNDNDFREATYSVVPSATDWFNVFAIKVCLYTLNSSKVPVVKNLRVVAIE